MADKWEAAGRSDELLVTNGWRLLALTCWTASAGARSEGVSPSIAALEEASVLHMGGRDWSDSLLSERHYCEHCGETYRLENLHLCSKCMRVYCTWCLPKESAPNGNRLHHCGGEMVG
jgi:hypothetical protein